jgi:hypothetical protein
VLAVNAALRHPSLTDTIRYSPYRHWAWKHLATATASSKLSLLTLLLAKSTRATLLVTCDSPITKKRLPPKKITSLLLTTVPSLYPNGFSPSIGPSCTHLSSPQS